MCTRFTRCAFVVAASFVGIAQTQASVDARGTTGDVRVQGDKTRPYLIFGCDRQTGDLDSLFTPALVAELKELGAGVALSTEDFSSARAQVVRRLSDAGIPMTAWIVLPREQGYYVNVGNARADRRALRGARRVDVRARPAVGSCGSRHRADLARVRGAHWRDAAPGVHGHRAGVRLGTRPSRAR